MEPTSLTQSPFAVLTFIVTPALLTNSSSVLALSTINRMLRTRERMNESYSRRSSAHTRTASPPDGKPDGGRGERSRNKCLDVKPPTNSALPMLLHFRTVNATDWPNAKRAR